MKLTKLELKRLIKEEIRLLKEKKEEKRYIVTAEKYGRFSSKKSEYKSRALTLPELIKYYSYTLEVGKS